MRGCRSGAAGNGGSDPGRSLRPSRAPASALSASRDSALAPHSVTPGRICGPGPALRGCPRGPSWPAFQIGPDLLGVAADQEPAGNPRRVVLAGHLDAALADEHESVPGERLPELLDLGADVRLRCRSGIIARLHCSLSPIVFPGCAIACKREMGNRKTERGSIRNGTLADPLAKVLMAATEGGVPRQPVRACPASASGAGR